jgi:hypothetical protein
VLQAQSNLAMAVTRLALRHWAKAWIYNKYQAGAGFLSTFLPAENLSAAEA